MNKSRRCSPFNPVIPAVFAGIILFAVAGQIQSQDNPYAESYLRLLQDRGIAADAPSLRKFLESQAPGLFNVERYQKYLRELGDDDYAVREAAMQALMAQPPKSTDDLEKLASGSDPELRWRSRLILDHLRQPGSDLLYAALIVITSQKITGLTDAVLGVAPRCTSDSMQLALSRALVTSSTAMDADLLRSQLKSDDARLRAACLTALVNATGEPAVPDVLPLLDDPSEQVRFDAAMVLLKHRRAESLRAFGKLLDAETLTIRNRSIHALRTNLKVSLPYSGYEPEEDRRRNAAEWRRTIEVDLQKTSSPDSPAAPAARHPQLVFHVRPLRQLIVVGADGGFSVRKPIPDHLTFRVVANGGLLQADRTRRIITELNSSGEEVWKSDELDEHPLIAVRREDGVTLAVTAEGTLVEINAAGDITRKSNWGPLVDLRATTGQSALLVSFNPGVIRRIDVTGRLEWTSAELARPTSVCPLPDGHLLVTLHQSSRVADIAPGGAIEFLETPFESPSEIQLLKDGRLAVLDARGAHIADRRGALVETMISFAASSAP